jgi:hypothetical protein
MTGTAASTLRSARLLLLVAGAIGAALLLGASRARADTVPSDQPPAASQPASDGLVPVDPGTDTTNPYRKG